MRVKLLTFRYSSSLGGFDDTPLLEFTRDKEVLSFREHFFTVNDMPHLACVVTYEVPACRPQSVESASAARADRSNGGRRRFATCDIRDLAHQRSPSLRASYSPSHIIRRDSVLSDLSFPPGGRFSCRQPERAFSCRQRAEPRLKTVTRTAIKDARSPEPMKTDCWH